MNVSVIIPTYNDWERLELCLESLYNQSYHKERIELIVVNNSNFWPTKQKKNRSDFNVQFITEPKRGSYAARNRGLALASGELIAFTDSDCVPDRHWLAEGVACFMEDNALSLLAGDVRFFFLGTRPTAIEYLDSATNMNQEYYADLGFGATANLFVRNDVFKDIGFFDSTLRSGGDYEFGKRASKAGYRIKYSRAAYVLHPARSTLKELFEKGSRVAKGQKQLARDGLLQEGQLTIRSFLPALRVPTNRCFLSPDVGLKIRILFWQNIKKYLNLIYRLMP